MGKWASAKQPSSYPLPPSLPFPLSLLSLSPHLCLCLLPPQLWLHHPPFSPMVVKPADPRKQSAVSTGTSPCRIVPTLGLTCSPTQPSHPPPPSHPIPSQALEQAAPSPGGPPCTPGGKPAGRGETVSEGSAQSPPRALLTTAHSPVKILILI